MSERIIVSMTSYKPRLQNLPAVLDTIFAQTHKPDLVVLNLAYEEVLPENVAEYLEKHDVEIYRVPDTKVYKKLIPTLKRYPNDAVITIDDDFLYPSGMIEEFVQIHLQYPNNPIGGSHWPFASAMARHCGCASLTKSQFLGDYIYKIDQELIRNCPSGDVVYAYLSTLNGYPYICTTNEYFLNMPSYNETEGYSSNMIQDGQQRSFDYCKQRFGELPEFYSAYLGNNALAHTFSILKQHEVEILLEQQANKIHATHAYRIGKFILKPISWMRNLLN